MPGTDTGTAAAITPPFHKGRAGNEAGSPLQAARGDSRKSSGTAEGTHMFACVLPHTCTLTFPVLKHCYFKEVHI